MSKAGYIVQAHYSATLVFLSRYDLLVSNKNIYIAGASVLVNKNKLLRGASVFTQQIHDVNSTGFKIPTRTELFGNKNKWITVDSTEFQDVCSGGIITSNAIVI